MLLQYYYFIHYFQLVLNHGIITGNAEPAIAMTTKHYSYCELSVTLINHITTSNIDRGTRYAHNATSLV